MPIYITEDKEIVILLKPKDSCIYHLCCIGRKRHYRKDGSCKHTAWMLSQMKPWHRARTVVDYYGGKTPAAERKE